MGLRGGVGVGVVFLGGFGLFSSFWEGGNWGIVKCEETREGRRKPSPGAPSGTMKIQFKTTPVLGVGGGGHPPPPPPPHRILTAAKF